MADRINVKKLFPGVLWTDAEWHAKRDELEAELVAKGITGHELLFATSRAMEEYQRTQPSLRERQRILRDMRPPPEPTTEFTDDEIDYLIERLAGVNDPTGQDVLGKLMRMRDGRHSEKR